MEAQSRPRPPTLHPVWTGPDEYSRHHKNPPYSARSSVFSPVTRSPNMPSPMYPRSPGYDYSMRRHEQAMLESLDSRGRPRPLEIQDTRTTVRSLSPIAEANWDRRRSSFASVASPRAPAPTPVSPRPPLYLQHPRPQSLAAETRSMLVNGLPSIHVGSANSSGRRQSMPPALPTPRRNSQHTRDELQAWGHVFFGNASDASCFVSPLALRRSSESSSTDDATDDAASPAPRPQVGNRVTIRARVRPRELGRKPFLLKREFDMDELRATIPEPSPNLKEPRRFSADVVKPNGHGHGKNRRRSSTASVLDSESSPVRSTNTVPIHAAYARAYFPVLAALIYSGHIKPGDIIDLPLPRPEVWTQTVAYAYTGQGDLTEAIKQNIMYLGGKV
ncbi:hypothetical protein QBC47DRAFT_363311 [Echria macrotheca]|uniref:Uncharacterized protein n=1 Tax=Echria macrotheca TaxID=438768 RepID=A0AAJ0B6F0_9PEZI|nr:hypothetical protein QBC47DRAFT_363311 [Echria macrotheca]